MKNSFFFTILFIPKKFPVSGWCPHQPQKTILIFTILLLPKIFFGWGFFAHKLINKQAVYSLPQPLQTFYKKHIEYIESHAADADKRRAWLNTEAPLHYIDADHYEKITPLDTIPHRWKDAVEKYSEDTLKNYGTVPWNISLLYIKLKEAFLKKDVKMILKLSADIGHYIADANVPLHTTENYNGQFTEQTGIHALWESRLPENFSKQYDLLCGPAIYIDNVSEIIWKTVEQSFGMLDSVLLFEKEATKNVGEDYKYSLEQKGRNVGRTYSEKFLTEYNELLDEQIERRIKNSIILVSSVWYSAWADAGMPDLNLLSLEEEEIEKQKDESPNKIMLRVEE